MSPSPDVPEAEAAELVRMMKEACCGSPVMTPEGAGVMLSVLINELGKIAQQAEDGAGIKQEWGKPSEVAKVYGLHRVTMAKLLAAWAAAGKVQVRQIFNEVTRAYGDRLYNLADVDKLMKATAAEGQPRGTKSKKGAA